ncbi:MAG: S-layer homology domain-containing protein [Bacillaceae bacterium]|nr:S-layer homology domain-containing protein [Bacillaceae bacterium]
MKNILKKSVPAVLATSLVFSMGAGAVDAKGPKDKNSKKDHPRHEFEMKDMNNHWAQSTVEKLSLLGIIKGYEDKTFKPNKPVTRTEAVVMTVRMMGLEEEASEYADDRLPFRDAPSIPSWARGSVALALDKGLIEESHVFQGNTPATRLYVTMLMVNAIGLEFDGDWEEAKTYFEDIDNLDEESKAALAYAVLQELVKGYEDGTFKPNKKVTRAEMAALLERAKEKLNDEEAQQEEEAVDGDGVITGINFQDETVTLNVYEDSTEEVTYTVDDDARIYIDGKAAEFDDLDVGMELEFVLGEDDEIIYIDAKTEEEIDYEGAYHGEITEVDGKKVWFKVDLVEMPFILSDDVKVYLGLDRVNDEEEIEALLKEGAEATFFLNEEGIIEQIIFTGTLDEEDVTEEEEATEEETDLGMLADVDELKIEVEGDDDQKLEFKFEQEDEGYEAKVELKSDRNKMELSGKAAVVAILDLLDQAGVDFDEENADIEQLVEYLVEEYELDGEGKIEVKIEVDGQKYEYEEEFDDDDEDDDDDDDDEDNDE